MISVQNLQQGYAFVQFEQAEDADNACEVLNGKRWKGVNIGNEWTCLFTNIKLTQKMV